MTSPDNPDRYLKESSPPLQSPEETVVELLKGLAKEPTDENFAAVQAFLNDKSAAAKNDIDAFRYVLKYFEEKNRDAFHPNDTYKYPIEYNPPNYESPVKKLTRLILHREVSSEPQTRWTSVVGIFPSRLHVEYPENWNYLMTKYVEFPVFMASPKTNQVAPDTPTSDWEILMQAKAELAELYRRANKAISDFSGSGYDYAADKQVDVIKELHTKMGLVYKGGFLVQEQA